MAKESLCKFFRRSTETSGASRKSSGTTTDSVVALAVPIVAGAPACNEEGTRRPCSEVVVVVKVAAAGAHQADLHTKRFDGMGWGCSLPLRVRAPHARLPEGALASGDFGNFGNRKKTPSKCSKGRRRGELFLPCYTFFFSRGQNLRLRVLPACVTPEIYTQHFGFRICVSRSIDPQQGL